MIIKKVLFVFKSFLFDIFRFGKFFEKKGWAICKFKTYFVPCPPTWTILFPKTSDRCAYRDDNNVPIFVQIFWSKPFSSIFATKLDSAPSAWPPKLNNIKKKINKPYQKYKGQVWKWQKNISHNIIVNEWEISHVLPSAVLETFNFDAVFLGGASSVQNLTH